MWFKMKSWTVEEAKNSEYQVNIEEKLDCDAATAFEYFRGEHIYKWFGDITSAKWISDEQEQVRAVRQVNLKTMNVQEHFLAWENNKQFTFYVRASSLPLLNKMIEDCTFIDHKDGTSSFKWDIYYEPNFLVGLLSPVTKFIFSYMFTSATKGLKKYVREMK